MYNKGYVSSSLNLMRFPLNFFSLPSHDLANDILFLDDLVCFIKRGLELQSTYFIGGGPFRRRRFGAGQLGAVPFRRRTFRRHFLIFLYFSNYEEKKNEADYFLNAFERKPVETRVLNPTASEASYKPKQRSYRKTNRK